MPATGAATRTGVVPNRWRTILAAHVDGSRAGDASTDKSYTCTGVATQSSGTSTPTTCSTTDILPVVLNHVTVDSNVTDAVVVRVALRSSSSTVTPTRRSSRSSPVPLG